ncbi:hypothetical protein ADL15_04895 [Actinoplanes awajinensis subsp. mycoplanecinus]|uniref:Uncharacterized protein n=2 Tax=Actinoplanes awajinensis TaxID=135946 RepID=A0A0X3V9V7_9ACTN|nr:hypothetical protein ADL15_04895 [Actinoplanes awajinensis subsp. mycoplanecinus]
MDALVFRLPLLLDQAGRAVDETVLAVGGKAATARAVQLHLARAAGTLESTQQAVASGMTTALATTSRTQLTALQDLIDAEYSATVSRHVSATSAGAEEIAGGIGSVTEEARRTTAAADTTARSAHELADAATRLRDVVATFTT